MKIHLEEMQQEKSLYEKKLLEQKESTECKVS